MVLATSIAESSLTIEGVRSVVDCGLARLPVLDAASGLSRLTNVPVSQASAEQRRGRAGAALKAQKLLLLQRIYRQKKPQRQLQLLAYI